MQVEVENFGRELEIIKNDSRFEKKIEISELKNVNQKNSLNEFNRLEMAEERIGELYISQEKLSRNSIIR